MRALHRIALPLVLAMGVAGLSGCADPQRTTDIGVPFDAGWVQYIQMDTTTRGEVVDWFGSPVARTTLSDDDGIETDNFRYSYLHGAARDDRVRSEYLEVEFDADGRVTGVYFTEADTGPPDV